MATKNPFQGTDVDPFEAARDTKTGEIKREMPKAEPKAEAPKQQSFGQAFAAARRAGDATFMFGGKKFSTARADDKKSPPPTPSLSASKQRDLDMTESRRAGQENMRAVKMSQAMKAPGRVGPTKERAEAMSPQKKAEAPKPAAKKEESRASTARKSRREGVKKDPSQMVERARPSAASRTRYAEGGSVKGAGIEKRGMRKCKIV